MKTATWWFKVCVLVLLIVACAEEPGSTSQEAAATSDKATGSATLAGLVHENRPGLKVLVSGLNRPYGLALDPNGNVLCTDEGKDGRGLIKRISHSGHVETIFESPVADSGAYVIRWPGDLIALRNGALLTIDRAFGEVFYVLTPDSAVQNYPAFMGSNGIILISEEWSNRMAHAMTLDEESGEIYIAGWATDLFHGNTVEELHIAKTTADEFDGHDRRPSYDLVFDGGPLADYKTATASAVRREQYLVALGNGGLWTLTEYEEGTPEDLWKSRWIFDYALIPIAIDGTFSDKEILGMVVDSSENLFVAANKERKIGVIYKISALDDSVSVLAEGLVAPAGMAITDGRLYVADFGAGRIWQMRI